MSRFIVWLVTIAGLLPVACLSIVSLRAHALAARIQEQSPESGSVSLIGSHRIEIGPPITKLRLSAETWPAVVTVCGIVSVVFGMFFLLPGKPQRFYRNGLSRIEHYVDRVLQSRKNYASVAIAKPDGASAVLIARRDRKVLLSVISVLSVGATSDLQTKIRNLYASRGITPSNEVLSSNICQFEFAASLDPKTTADLVRALFTDLFGVDDSTGLEFTTTGF